MGTQEARSPRLRSGGAATRQLADLLELAGSERANHVLALLRELLLMPTAAAGGPDLMTIEQVAERLQVSPRTIRRAIDAGELDAVELPIRGGLRVRESALECWLAEHRTPQQPVWLRPRRGQYAHVPGRLEVSDL